MDNENQLWLYSWLWFITVKEYKAKSAKRKGAWGEAQRNSDASTQWASSSSHTGGAQIPWRVVTTPLQCCQRGRLIRDPGPRAFWGYWSERPCAWHVPKARAPRRRAGVHIYAVSEQVFVLLSVNGENPPQIQASSHQPRASFVSRPFWWEPLGLLCSFFSAQVWFLHYVTAFPWDRRACERMRSLIPEKSRKEKKGKATRRQTLEKC